MAVKLHRCGTTWAKVGPHPCWKVQKALDDAGIAYEVELHPTFPRSKRTRFRELSGQDLLPAIELEDGSIIREESALLVERIRSGRLLAAG